MHDITPVISSTLGVFPGDTRPTREILLDLARGDAITLSTLRSTVHLGAHVDGPNHYDVDGRSIDEQPLDLYIGPCQVIDVAASRRARIATTALPSSFEAMRVLLRTGTFPDPHAWNDDFAGLEPSVIHLLADQGVQLVGIDTPSVDLVDSKDLPAHAACAARNVSILEGIVLAGVDEGVYELIALPLRLEGFDASPVRAILRNL